MNYLLATHVFQSRTLCRTNLNRKRSPPALNFMSACRRLITHTPNQVSGHQYMYSWKCNMKSENLRSVSLRNSAVSGKSCNIQSDARAQSTVNNPSRMKIHAHPGFPPIPSMFWIAEARSPPVQLPVSLHRDTMMQRNLLKAPATVAEEKNTATLVPNSERLYQLNETARVLQPDLNSVRYAAYQDK